MGSGAGQDLGEEDEQGWGSTAKLSWLGDWENEGGHFPETETNPFILYVGENVVREH